MDVIIDVILAEAVVPRAAGAVAELQLRVIRIRAAADSALVIVELGGLLASYPLGLAAEVDGVGAGSARYGAQEVAPAEDEEIQYRDDGQQIHREGARHHRQNKEYRVHQCEPFHLDRDDEEQQHLHIREKRRKGEKHREVHILRRHSDVDAGRKIDDEPVKHGEDNAAEKVDVELRRPPILLKGAADPVVKIHRDERQHTRPRRHEREGDEPPHLPVEKTRERVGEEAQKVAVREVGQKSQHHVADDDIEHQVGDAKIRVQDTEAVDRLVEFFQYGIPRFDQITFKNIMTQRRGKVINKV